MAATSGHVTCLEPRTGPRSMSWVQVHTGTSLPQLLASHSKQKQKWEGTGFRKSKKKRRYQTHEWPVVAGLKHEVAFFFDISNGEQIVVSTLLCVSFLHGDYVKLSVPFVQSHFSVFQ